MVASRSYRHRVVRGSLAGSQQHRQSGQGQSLRRLLAETGDATGRMDEHRRGSGSESFPGKDQGGAWREYEQAHKQRSDAHYVGGSLVRTGDKEEAGQWFKQVLELSLDQYQDTWDIHAYPQQAPRFGGAIGNDSNEDERGGAGRLRQPGQEKQLAILAGRDRRQGHAWFNRTPLAGRTGRENDRLG